MMAEEKDNVTVEHEEQSEVSDKLEENSQVEIFTSYQTMLKAVSDFEENTKSNFICSKKTAEFGNEDFQVTTKPRIHWEGPSSQKDVLIKFTGVPFVVVGRKTLLCHLGKDVGLAKKRKYAEQRDSKQGEDNPVPKKRRMIQNSKKMGCTAKIHISHIINYPEFKISNNTESRKKMASKRLREALQKDKEKIKGIHGYITKFPKFSEHASHAVTGELANIREKVDPRIQTKIIHLHQSGVKNISEMQKHINTFVAQELFPSSDLPEDNRRRFFPTRKDIANLMMKSRHEKRSLVLCQENVLQLVTLWKEENPEINIYCRTREENVADPTTFLFCYQTPWQKKILKTYGNHMTLLDATYRTLRSALPLFFLFVRTNVCYVVVGTFVIQNETSVCIQEALEIFQTWNEEWKPKYFLVDFCQEDINAISTVFKDTNLFLCDFYRERAWTAWIKKKDHAVYDCRQRLLSMLRKIALASTQEDCNTALHALAGSQIWKKNDSLRQWFAYEWLPHIKIWAYVYRTQELHVGIHTNNGLERQNEVLKNNCLEGYKNCTLGEMITVIHSKVLPNAYKKYVQLNLQSSELYQKYTEEVPVFLRNRPREFVTHVLKRLSSDLTGVDVNISNATSCIFEIKSESEIENVYTVDFSNAIPSCTCADWQNHFLPCKHMCFLFTYVEEWGWEKVHPDYINNPLFTLDMECFIPEALQSAGSDVAESCNLANPAEYVVAELPPRSQSKRIELIHGCAQKLKRLLDTVHLLKDEQCLEELETSVDFLLENALSKIPNDHEAVGPTISSSPFLPTDEH